MPEQLYLFEEDPKIVNERRMNTVEQKCEKIRKGQYAHITRLNKKVEDLEKELEFLKSCICKGNLFL